MMEVVHTPDIPVIVGQLAVVIDFLITEMLITRTANRRLLASCEQLDDISRQSLPGEGSSAKDQQRIS